VAEYQGEWLRKIYGVPAHAGGRVVFEGRPGVITGFDGHYLRVRLDGDRYERLYHPTWHMTYEGDGRG